MANSDYKCPPCIGVLQGHQLVCIACDRVIVPKAQAEHCLACVVEHDGFAGTHVCGREITDKLRRAS